MGKPRKLYCVGCKKYLGMIEKGNLHKKFLPICEDCDTKRMAADLAFKTRKADPLGDILGGIFKS